MSEAVTCAGFRSYRGARGARSAALLAMFVTGSGVFGALPARADGGAGAGGAAAAEGPPSPADASSEAPQAGAAAGQPAASDAVPGAGMQAYHRALTQSRVDAAAALSRERLREILADAEAQLALGRHDEAIGVLVAVIESPRFGALQGLEEGRELVLLLGSALGRAGAHGLGRHYLLRLLSVARPDAVYRRAIARLVDFGIDSGDAATYLADVAALPAEPDQSWVSDVAYLRGLAHERAGEVTQALSAYAQVRDTSRFWAQAQYRSGLLEVERRQFAPAERAFCRVADPKQTPRLAPLLGGNEFFHVRDLSRLALGRVAHEQYRFDDAGYYYHLVPADSERLPEALYESATARYEAKDYDAAQRLLRELEGSAAQHAYADEAQLLGAYVDLARCEFDAADVKLQGFLQRYEPVLRATQQLLADADARRALLGRDSHSALERVGEAGASRAVLDVVDASLRLDPGYARASQQLAGLDYQLSALARVRQDIVDLAARLRDPDAVKPRWVATLASSPAEQRERVSEQVRSARRLLREASARSDAALPELSAAAAQLDEIERAARVSAREVAQPAAAGDALSSLLARDSLAAAELLDEARRLRDTLAERRDELAVQALKRLSLRLTRLVRRARAGRIESVLGQKRAVELEIEALSQGFLPAGAIDSLDAARYLRDDEEYWPADGEDWADEYVGGEGLR